MILIKLQIKSICISQYNTIILQKLLVIYSMNNPLILLFICLGVTMIQCDMWATLWLHHNAQTQSILIRPDLDVNPDKSYNAMLWISDTAIVPWDTNMYARWSLILLERGKNRWKLNFSSFSYKKIILRHNPPKI